MTCFGDCGRCRCDGDYDGDDVHFLNVWQSRGETWFDGCDGGDDFQWREGHRRHFPCDLMTCHGDDEKLCFHRFDQLRSSNSGSKDHGRPLVIAFVHEP